MPPGAERGGATRRPRRRCRGGPRRRRWPRVTGGVPGVTGTKILRCPPMVARCRTRRHAADRAHHRRLGLGGRRRRPGGPQDLRRACACTARARSPRSRRRTPPRCAASWRSSRPSCASRSRRCSTTSGCAASRPACWPTRADRRARWPPRRRRGGSPARRRPGPRVLHRAPARWSPTGVAAYLERSSPTRSSPRRTCARRRSSAAPTVEALETVAARVAVAERIRATGARYVVVKGGHLTDSADDVVAGPDGVTVLRGHTGGHRQRPRDRLLPLGRHGRACWPGAPRCPTPSRRPRPSWRRALAGARRLAPRAPGTGRSTISGGPARRRLARHDAARDRHGARRRAPARRQVRDRPGPVRAPDGPHPGGFSIRPAMIVLGLAALILVVFVTIGIVTSQSPAPVASTRGARRRAGVPLQAESAAGLLGPIVASGEPPTNILNAVFVPAGSVRVSHQNNAAGSGQFDAQVELALRRLAGRGARLLRRRHEAAGLAGLRPGRRRQHDPTRSRSSASWPAPTGTTGRWGRPSRRRRSARARRRPGRPTSPSACFQQDDESRSLSAAWPAAAIGRWRCRLARAACRRARAAVTAELPRARPPRRRGRARRRLGQQVGPDEEIDRVEQVAHPGVRRQQDQHRQDEPGDRADLAPRSAACGGRGGGPGAPPGRGRPTTARRGSTRGTR